MGRASREDFPRPQAEHPVDPVNPVRILCVSIPRSGKVVNSSKRFGSINNYIPQKRSIGGGNSW